MSGRLYRLCNCSVSDVQTACLTVIPSFVTVPCRACKPHDWPLIQSSPPFCVDRTWRTTGLCTCRWLAPRISPTAKRAAAYGVVGRANDTGTKEPLGDTVGRVPPTRRSLLHRSTGTEPELSAPDLSYTLLLQPLDNAKRQKLSRPTLTGTNLIQRIEHFW